MDLLKFEAGVKDNCPIYAFLGLRVLEAKDGIFKASIPNTKESGNHIGIMHAGALFALGEFLGGLITAYYLDDPRKFQPVVRDLKIDFKAPAMTDIIATAEFTDQQALDMNTSLATSGRYDFQQKAVLTDSDGTVVAQTLGSYALRNFMG